jgi:hypothetical protein
LIELQINPQPNQIMPKRLTHIAPVKLGIVLGVIYGVMSLIFAVPIFLIFSLVGAASARGGAHPLPVIFTGVFVIFVPFIYAAFGFIGGAIAALVYNLVAKWTGGVEFTTEAAA